MNKLETRIKELELELNNLKSGINAPTEPVGQAPQEEPFPANEEKFRVIVENSADAIFITDQQGKYTYTNKAASLMLGFSSEEMKSKTIADLSPPDKREEYYGFFKQTLSAGKNFAEIELLKKDGNYISVDLNVILLPDGFIYGSCRDISKRKKLEETLKNVNERFVLATAAAYISVWEYDLITDIIQIDDNFNEMLGITQENYQIGNEQFEKFIHPDDIEIIRLNTIKAIKSDERIKFEFRIIRHDGKIRNIRAYGKIVKDDNNKPVKFIGVNRDITDSRNAELAIKENERLLLQLNADKDRFISILSHDLRSPFNNLLGLSDVLTENIHQFHIDEIETLANQIKTTARSTYNLLEDLLMWARTQQGKIPFNPQLINFRDICIDVLEPLNPLADAKTITINYPAPDGTKIFADIDMIKMILRNLVSNAIKFTNIGGAIIIHAEKPPENITISVSDNGVGISPGDLTKLFNITEVLSTKGTANEKGTGLGLLLCKEFVEKHGGKIWVDSKVGEGSVFKFTLPMPVS